MKKETQLIMTNMAEGVDGEEGRVRARAICVHLL